MICPNETCNTNDDPTATEAGTTQELPAAQRPNAHPRPRTTRGVLTFFAAAAVGSAALAAVGLAPRSGQEADLAATTKASNDARRAVATTRPSREGAAYELRLPGSTAPLQVTVLHARTNGYLKAFHADIGDHVRAGQVLAEIESPETDQQLREARATLERNRADLALAAQRLGRIQALWDRQAANRSELDDLTAQHNAAVAAVRVGEAVVSRLETEQSYQKVVAPFDGVVTQRNVELGSLVTAGSASGVTPLFRFEQDGVLKVLIDVPQSAAPAVTIGQQVQVEIREFAGRRFGGKVVRTAGSIDPGTRTLRTEVHVPNPRGDLLAGLYTQVFLPVQDPRNPVRIPAAALVIDAAGTQVVAVDAGNVAHRHPVTLGRDFGREIEVTAGLGGDERLVISPRDDLHDGDRVDVR
jgi:RND family efflux transporter MFP subunit